MKIVPDVNSGDGCTKTWMNLIPLNFKMVKIVICVLCISYYNKKFILIYVEKDQATHSISVPSPGPSRIELPNSYLLHCAVFYEILILAFR